MNHSTSTVKGLDKAKIVKMPCRATHSQTNLANASDREMRNVLVPSTFMLDSILIAQNKSCGPT